MKIFCALSWIATVGCFLLPNFVRNASEDEVYPFASGLLVLSIVLTLRVIQQQRGGGAA